MALVEHACVEQYEIRLLVSGSRGWNDYALFDTSLRQYLKFIKADVGNCVLITGAAWSGADDMAIRWGESNDWDWAEYPAKWDDLTVPGAVVRYDRQGRPYNVKAGFDRNREMRDVSTHLLAFWDMRSPGTKNMIQLCNEEDSGILDVCIIPIANEQRSKRSINRGKNLHDNQP